MADWGTALGGDSVIVKHTTTYYDYWVREREVRKEGRKERMDGWKEKEKLTDLELLPMLLTEAPSLRTLRSMTRAEVAEETAPPLMPTPGGAVGARVTECCRCCRWAWCARGPPTAPPLALEAPGMAPTVEPLSSGSRSPPRTSS